LNPVGALSAHLKAERGIQLRRARRHLRGL